MTALRSSIAKQGLVIDTNIFLLVIGYRCSLDQELGVADRIDLLEKLRGQPQRLSPERFDDLWNLFNYKGRRIVTQHVIAESWSRGLRHEGFRGKADALWRGILQVLAHPAIEEAAAAVRTMYERPEYRAIAEKIGPTDACLIYVAEKEGSTILTEDGKLLHWAQVRSLRTLQLSQIGLP